MGAPRVWLLNFEADLELGRGRASTPDRGLAARLRELRAEHAARVLRPGDHQLDPEAPPPEEWRGLEGRAWCPTPWAQERLAQAGLRPAAAPPLEVLRHANSRAFNAALGQTLPEACFSNDPEELAAALERPGPSGRWLLKRDFSASGRGQRRVRAGEVGEAERLWLAASMRHGGVQLEPFVEIEREFSTHGRIAQNGSVELREPCWLLCDEWGAWRDTRPAPVEALAPDEARALLDEARRAADALVELGYFGPFGVDAYLWRDGAGERRLQPRGEVNARMTLGWRVSFPEA